MSAAPAHKWSAAIWVHGKKIHLGYYGTKEAASRVKASALYAYSRGWRQTGSKPSFGSNASARIPASSRIGLRHPTSQKKRPPE
jgi:hypothetical protein